MKKSVAQNTVFSALKSLSSTVFPLVTYPYAARVLAADGLGKVNFSASIITYITLLAGLGISTYAIREGSEVREDKSKLDVFSSQVFTINVVSTLAALLILVVVVAVWPALNGYKTLLAIQAIGVIGTTIGVDWIYNIKEEYWYILVRTVVVQFVSAILLFLLVKNKNDYIVYACITVFSAVGGNIFNLVHARKYVRIRLTTQIDLSRHIRPIVVLFANSIAMNVYINMDTTLLGVMLGDVAVGLYSVSGKIYSIIKNIISSAITVSIPRATAYRTESLERYRSLLTRVARGLILTAFPGVYILASFSELAVALVGGGDFAAAAPTLSVLALAILFSIASMFYTNLVLLPFHQEGGCLKATSAGAICNLVLNLIILKYVGMIGAAITTLISEMIVFLVVWRMGSHFFQFSMGDFRHAMLSAVLAVISGQCIKILMSEMMTASVYAWILELCAVVLAVLIVYSFRERNYLLKLIRKMFGR